MDSAMGTLCQYCKVLVIDDAAWGGFRDESIPNKNVLAFSRGKTHELDPNDDWNNSEFLRNYPDCGSLAQIRYFTCHYGRHDTFPELPNLKESAAECGFCALLYNWIRWQSDEDISRLSVRPKPIHIRSFDYEWYKAIRKNGVPCKIFRRLRVHCIWEDHEPARIRGADIKIDTPNGSCATWLSIPKNLRKTPDLWERISMIKSSLRKCSDECGHSKSSNFVPSRLIYVGEKTEFGFGDPRLVIMSDSERLRDGCTKDNIEYAILSYCWGESTSSELMTTMDNLAAQLQKIPLAKMPATCRDAILVTRALGLKWLWIDAFCIIQGSNADWHNEAAEMAGVYGNAFVTIIPLRSLSSQDGFLDQVKGPTTARIPFKSSIDSSVEGYYTLRVSQIEWEINRTLERELCTSKWQSRGWTYQEGVMSLRKMYFGETGIYFRCASQRTITCQSTPRNSFELEGEFWRSPERRETTTIADRTKSSWYQSIQHFSTRDLTFKTDVFPAISAIAKMHCNGIQEDYHCGLWKSDLHNGVLWGCFYRGSNPEKHVKRLMSQNDYVAPSWSWASMYAMGHSISDYPGEVSSPLWEILETEALLVDPSNPFGPVLSGHIIVRGRWCPLSSLILDQGDDVWRGDKRLGYCCFDWNPFLRASFMEHLVILLVAEYAEGGVGGMLLVPSVGNETWYRVGLFRAHPYFGFGEKVSKEDLYKSFPTSGDRVFKII